MLTYNFEHILVFAQVDVCLLNSMFTFVHQIGFCKILENKVKKCLWGLLERYHWGKLEHVPTNPMIGLTCPNPMPTY